MAFEERQRLLRAYRAAVQAYHEAGAKFDESTFQESLQRMERARNQAETARVALLTHEHLPLGSAAKDASASPVAMNGSTVMLFNIDTERWVLFDIGECGPPPERALAYAPEPGHKQGEWVADAREMNSRERQHVKLYYTEAGLAILREAGLEM